MWSFDMRGFYFIRCFSGHLTHGFFPAICALLLHCQYLRMDNMCYCQYFCTEKRVLRKKHDCLPPSHPAHCYTEDILPFIAEVLSIGNICRNRSDGPCVPTILLYDTLRTGSFPGVKQPRRVLKHPLTFSAEVQERVDALSVSS
jgi:hypothetical protein